MKDLEDFIDGSGENGFIYVSMGTVVKVPYNFRRLFLKAFAELPYHVIWKCESSDDFDLPANVKISKWLPQQDILGHRKLKAFVTHGGLNSMFETVYHGAPAVVLPVFADQNANSEKQKADGYGKMN